MQIGVRILNKMLDDVLEGTLHTSATQFSLHYCRQIGARVLVLSMENEYLDRNCAMDIRNNVSFADTRQWDRGIVNHLNPRIERRNTCVDTYLLLTSLKSMEVSVDRFVHKWVYLGKCVELQRTHGGVEEYPAGKNRWLEASRTY